MRVRAAALLTTLAALAGGCAALAAPAAAHAGPHQRFSTRRSACVVHPSRGTSRRPRRGVRCAAARTRPTHSLPAARLAEARGAGSGPLQAMPAGPYAISLSWPAVGGATSFQISLDGTVMDRIPAATANAYTLHELWPQSTYSISVQGLSPDGAPLATFSTSAATPPATGPFPRLYGASAFVNTPIGANPVLDPNSSAMVGAAITPYLASANLSNDTAWGIPIVTADPQSPTFQVGCQDYWCSTAFGPEGIPAGAQPSTGGDGHLVVLEPDGSELDMWTAQHTAAGWTAGERWVEPAGGPAANCTTAWGCGAADAAGFALGAGVVRPEEIAQGHIDHALIIATPYTREGYIACPAISGDGRNASPTALPLGAHVQLDPSIDVAALPIPAWQKVIAVALQRYGAYVGDTGGSLEVRGESNLGRGYNAWAKAGVPADAPSLSDLPWSSLRVLSMSRCA